MWIKCGIEEVLDMAESGELGKIYLCTDLSQLVHFYGLQHGNVKYACLKCTWKNVLSNSELDTTDRFKKCATRDENHWKSCNLAISQFGDMHPNPKLNYSVEREPLDPRIFNLVKLVYAPLHIKLGLTLDAYQELKSYGIDGLTADWLSACGIKPKKQWGEYFQGGQCDVLLSKCWAIENYTHDYRVAKMLDYLKALKDIIPVINGVGQVDVDDIEDLKSMVEKVKSTYKETTMYPARFSLKLHYLANHTIEFVETEKITPGTVGEQDGEHIHSVITRLFSGFKGKWWLGPYKRVMEEWNSRRFTIK